MHRKVFYLSNWKWNSAMMYTSWQVSTSLRLKSPWSWTSERTISRIVTTLMQPAAVALIYTRIYAILVRIDCIRWTRAYPFSSGRHDEDTSQIIVYTVSLFRCFTRTCFMVHSLNHRLVNHWPSQTVSKQIELLNATFCLSVCFSNNLSIKSDYNLSSSYMYEAPLEWGKTARTMNAAGRDCKSVLVERIRLGVSLLAFYAL